MNQSKRAAFLLSVAALAIGATKAQAQETTGEIVVTGSNIRGIKPTGSQPIVIGQEEIQQLAKQNTTELLSQIPQMSTFNSVPTGSNNQGISVAQVSLRPNLGTGATLVLLNGRRVTPLGLTSQWADVSSIPTNAIKNVEIIADGASAVYGSDAVAGVINFITRKDDRIESNLSYGVSDHHYEQYNANQTYGKTWDSGNFFIAGEYGWHPRLAGRNTPESSQFFSSAGGSVSCPVATIGPSPVKCDLQDFNDIIQEEKRTSIFASVDQELGDKVRLFADGIYTSSVRQIRTGPPVLAGGANATMSANNPFNPTPGTAAPVFYALVPEFGLGADVNSWLSMIEGSLGAEVQLPFDWKFTASGSAGVSDNVYDTPGFNAANARTALAATTTATAFDPFQHRTSQAVLDAIHDQINHNEVDNGKTLGTVKVDGPIFDLPGGKVRVALGAEYRRDTQKQKGYSGSKTVGFTRTASMREREVSSAFGEIFVPIVGDGNQFPLVQALSLSIAGRYDDYTDVGETTNPKYGVDWRLSDDLKIFAVKSKSFQAPNLGATGDGAIQINQGGSAVVNAPAGRETLSSITLAGAAGILKPQTSENYSIGFELTPRIIPGLRLSLTNYDVEFNDFIQIPSAPCSNPLLAQFCLLSPSPTVPFAATDPILTQFTCCLNFNGGLLPAAGVFYIQDLRRTNLAKQTQNGFDYDISYRFPTWGGSLVSRFAGNSIRELMSGAFKGAPLVDQHKIVPTERFAVSTDFSTDNWTLGASLNHSGGYFASASVFQHVKAFDTYNIRSTWKPTWGGYASNLRFSFNIDNLLAEPPPFNPTKPGGRAQEIQLPADFRGRTVRVGLFKAW